MRRVLLCRPTIPRGVRFWKAFVAVGLAGVVAVCVVWVECRSDVPPTIHGRRLDDWLGVYRETYTPIGTAFSSEHIAAQKAIRGLGTNALPTLLRMLRAKDTSVATAAEAACARLHLKPPWKPGWVKRSEAVCGFKILGEEAAPAASVLASALAGPLSAGSRYSFLNAVSALGPAAKEASPSVVAALKHPDGSVRVAAVSALGRLHIDPGTTLAALAGVINDPVPVVRSRAIREIGRLGADATGLVEQLRGLTNDPVRYVRLDAVAALEAIEQAGEVR